MGLAKKTATAENLPEGTKDFRNHTGQSIAADQQKGISQYGEPKAVESGATAAIARLKSTKVKAETDSKPSAYKQRDFDAEARGKTRCVQFEAALMSPAIAGMKFDTMEQYLALVKQAAEAGVAYTFGA